MWKQLTINDLKTCLAKDELEKLSTVSVDLDTVIADTLSQAASAFRGAFLAKSYTIDPRDDYIPGSYVPFILAFARHLLWTRFPFASNYALDDARSKLLDQALKLLEKPSIGVDPVEYEPPSPGPEPQPTPSSGASSIVVPYQRFPDDPPLVWSKLKPWTI